MKRAVAGPLLVAAAALACAQPQAPPGGEPDEVPPRVVAVTPAHFDTITASSDPVVIRFDERISERLVDVQDLEEGVLVSPRTGAMRVERGRRSIEVSLAGGWQPGQVYQVVLLPVLRDLFGNRLTERVELVFSTGGAITPTAVAGFVEDRLTGEVVEDARLEAFRGTETVAYQTVTDTSGFFALRFIPAGTYELRAWRDQDQDGEIDFQEPQTRTELTLGARDTVILELALLPQDTTAARLAVAEAVDSTRVRLLFDDYFPPGPIDGSATLYRLPDSTRVAGGELVHGTRLDSLVAEEAARDTLAPEPAPGDTAQAPVDTAQAPPAQRAREARPGARREGQRDASAEPLPSRELIMILPAPLVPGAEYTVVVEGVTNIRRIPGGGGTARFQAPPRPEPPPDTLPGS